MTQQRDPVLVGLARLEEKVGHLSRQVNDLSKQVATHDKMLRWLGSAALLVVGIIGGPDAVQTLAGG